jgi:hypothetical protein
VNQAVPKYFLALCGLGACSLFGRLALADTPQGTYTVTAKGPRGRPTTHGRLLPHCGADADDYLSARPRLEIQTDTIVTIVNGVRWSTESRDERKIIARNPDTAKKIVIEAWFWRTKGTAVALLNYSEVADDGSTTCGTNQAYFGSHRP